MTLAGPAQGGIYFPPRFPTESNPVSTLVIDANDEAVGFVFQVAKAGTVDAILFNTATVTTGETVDVRIESVDASGFPSGTLLGTNSNGSQVIADGDDGVTFITALTTGVVVTQGQYVAVVIKLPASSSGNMQIRQITSADTASPYTLLFTGTWSKQTDRAPNCALQYSDGSYAYTPNVYPIASTSEVGYSANSTPDERGLEFTIWGPLQVIGFWVNLDSDGDWDMVLYNSSGTALQTLSTDGDFRRPTARATFDLLFTGSQTLAAGTYRLVVKPSTTTAVRIYQLTLDAAATRNAFPGGTDIQATERTNAGAWTDITTERYFMGLILDETDDGAGGGGGMIVHPGMSGGMRG